MYEYGKFGVIRELDIHTKSSEFYAWMMEVKHISRETLGRKEEREYFLEFMEDYNTATLPDVKYYDLGKWAANPANKKLLGASLDGLSDEDRLRVLRQQEREAANKQMDISRVMALKQELARTKDQDPSAFKQLKQDYLESVIQKPTFESLQRRREEKRAADLARANNPGGHY
jgi:hypothetical protein